MTSEAQKKAALKYMRKNTMGISLRLNSKIDADICDKLKSVENKNSYIKDLIRKDIENSKKITNTN